MWWKRCPVGLQQTETSGARCQRLAPRSCLGSDYPYPFRWVTFPSYLSTNERGCAFYFHSERIVRWIPFVQGCLYAFPHGCPWLRKGWQGQTQVSTELVQTANPTCTETSMRMRNWRSGAHHRLGQSASCFCFGVGMVQRFVAGKETYQEAWFPSISQWSVNQARWSWCIFEALTYLKPRALTQPPRPLRPFVQLGSGVAV